ncbi:hypothetical protein D3C73_1658460 [compost metagenome]
MLLTRNAPVTGWRTTRLVPQEKSDWVARPLADNSARGWISSFTSETSTTSASLWEMNGLPICRPSNWM